MSSTSSSDSEDDVKGVNGIKNFGNTCFINAIFQVITHLPYVIDFYKGNEYIKDGKVKKFNDDSLSYRLHMLIKTMYDNANCTIYPKKIIRWITKNIKLKDGDKWFKGDDDQEDDILDDDEYFRKKHFLQQDCHQIFMEFINALHEEVKYHVNFEARKINHDIKAAFKLHWDNHYSYIYEQFMGIYMTTQLEPTSSLMLPVPEKDNVTLEDCIEAADITVVIYPKVLVLCLKRYTNHVNKIHKTVTYPVNLQFFLKNYILRSVIMHDGRNMSHGHYTAICKHGDKYYQFNDKICIEVSSPKSKEAYMLFYSLK